MKPQARTIDNQPCWVIASSCVELAITRTGGHMAPVTFLRDTPRPVQPYYISPWQAERKTIDVPVLRPLRGDFFCMPFGGGSYRGETHTPHGETATAEWTFRGLERVANVQNLTLEMQTTVRPAKVTKNIRLVDGQDVVYSQHVIEGGRGRICLGHHATLAVPEEEGSLRVSTSPFRLGMTCPDLFSNPVKREYQSLAIGAKFTDLAKVPTLWKDPATADCTRFPARKGFTDLLAVFARISEMPAWTAAVCASGRYLWYSLKDPMMLPGTVFWMDNRGRHGEPWAGRNRCLGLEDVCSYFAHGLGPSAKHNLLNEAGIHTVIELSPKQPTIVNYIQGVLAVPPKFGRVASAAFAPGRVTFTDERGQSVTAGVHHEFLSTGSL